MHQFITAIITLMALGLSSSSAWADKYEDTIEVFRNAGESGEFFNSSYGYAVFPTIGKGGFYVGGAHGAGRVYEQGVWIGDTKMTQVTIGFQLGGQAFSQIIFFEDKFTLDQFTNGNFEFSAQASAVAITAGAQAAATTTGASAGASATQDTSVNVGDYNRGMAIFTVAKGGLMYEAILGGQKFTYEPRN